MAAFATGTENTRQSVFEQVQRTTQAALEGVAKFVHEQVVVDPGPDALVTKDDGSETNSSPKRLAGVYLKYDRTESPFDFPDGKQDEGQGRHPESHPGLEGFPGVAPEDGSWRSLPVPGDELEPDMEFSEDHQH